MRAARIAARLKVGPLDAKVLPGLLGARRAPKGAIAAKVTVESAFRFGFAAYDNAIDLLNAAIVLQTFKSYGPARSLAISAREEIGKFIASLLFAIGQYDAKRFAELVAGHGHQLKQLFGAIASGFGTHFEEDAKRFAGALDVEADTLEEGFKKAGARLKGIAAQIKQPPQAAVARMTAEIIRAHSGGDEFDRREGLYVDLVEHDGGLVARTPDEVTKRSAQDEIGRTRAYFDLLMHAGDIRSRRANDPGVSIHGVLDFYREMFKDVSGDDSPSKAPG